MDAGSIPAVSTITYFVAIFSHFFILQVTFWKHKSRRKFVPLAHVSFTHEPAFRSVLACLHCEIFRLLPECLNRHYRNIQIKNASQRTNNIREADDTPQIDNNYDNTANYISNDFQNCVSKKPKNSMSAQEKASTSIIVIVTIVVIVALIFSIVLTK